MISPPALKSSFLLAVRAACLGCAGVVLFLALAPVGGTPPAGHADKANHLGAFFVLTCLARAGWPLRPRTMLYALVTFGISIEVLQSFTPDHQADPLDVVADVIGVAIGWGAFSGMRLWAARRLVSSGSDPGEGPGELPPKRQVARADGAG